MVCFLISVSYFRRLVAWELQGAHYSAFSKLLSFPWTNLANKDWTTVEHHHAILIPKSFSRGSCHFYMLPRNGKVRSCSIINPLLTWAWTLLELVFILHTCLEWTALVLISEDFSKLTALEGSQPTPGRMRAPAIFLLLQRPLGAY